MSLINPIILYGLGLALIPVILHFLLRSKPRKLMFPALRLLQDRRRKNVRRMRLKHIWLLLLRMAVIALIVLAIARPSLPASDYSLSTREWVWLGGIALVAALIYGSVTAIWRRRKTAPDVLAHRRKYLRGGTALTTCLLLAFFVGWPYQQRIVAQMDAPVPSGASNLPVAGVFVFDTSLSMQYQQESKTSLDRAREIAVEHLSSLPTGSRIAVAESTGSGSIPFQADRATGTTRINNLDLHAVSRPLNERVRAAIRLQEDDRRRTLGVQSSVPDDKRQDLYLREIYVFTDLAASAWNGGAAHLLLEDLQRCPWLSVYLIDVGPREPLNVGVVSTRLSSETVSLGDRLTIEANIQATGIAEAERTVELYVDSPQGKQLKLGQSTVRLTGETAARVRFSINELASPFSQGELRLISSDPLTVDDVRYFTAGVQVPPEILLVAPHAEQADYLQAALAPEEQVQLGRARYRCTYSAPNTLNAQLLERFSVVCLISVESLEVAQWQALNDFVNDGGGLAIFLGTHTIATAVSYNDEVAQTIMPAELIANLKFLPPEFLDLANSMHPVFRRFEEYGGTGDLTTLEVRRYWKVEPATDARTIAWYTGAGGDRPSMLEKVSGKGRSILMTTAVDMKGWNDLPLAGWFIVFADQVIQYLSHQTSEVHNFTAGEDVLVSVPEQHRFRKYLLRKPGFQQLPGEIAEGSAFVNVADADQLGNYQIVPTDIDDEAAIGFSLNPSSGESEFRRLTTAEMDALFGEKRYSVADTIDGLTRNVADGRVGQEMFSLVLALVVVVFCGEHFVANWFYATQP